ncbi:hypothetical protein ABL78_2399 [Leptomonas seymouri]|uniref:Uncharacterized protein n=1 Tax=Leptomonas seymouri TaxID=5684 RepID=A0A0N1I0X5_LEPSE|nr:hypothetical protein ABL78_2399 [Leptomonas seymouri]|eukprot:KPI88503.1 hypothetical protein ABL78_2399 [Leptomonas seymouri]
MSLNISDSASPVSAGAGVPLSVTGSRLAHFVNNYSPVHDTALKHLELNTDVYLDSELGEKLTEDRRLNVQHHLVADRALREYCITRMNNGSMMRS